MKYKLLRDLPGVKAVTEMDALDIAKHYGSSIFGIGQADLAIAEKYLKDHPDFFEPIPEKSKTVYHLRNKDECFLLTNSGNIYIMSYHSSFDRERDHGFIFLTKEEAEKARDYARANTTILNHHKEHSRFKPDWNDGEEEKYIVLANMNNECIQSDISYGCNSGGICFFRSEEEAEKSIKDCNKEWKIIFGIN